LIWSNESLWKKAVLYGTLAMEQDRDNELFPLWMAFTVELVGRATLAHVHPSLLADPSAGEHVLYACGIGAPERPKSIPVKTVFDRCKVILPAFEETERVQCMALIDRRNAELHSGELAFAQFRTPMWLAGVFRACGAMAEFQGRTLAELFGKEHAAAASEMIAAADAELRKQVLSRIGGAKSAFQAVEAAGVTTAPVVQPAVSSRTASKALCPACGATGRIDGDVIGASEPKMGGDTIYCDLHILPTGFSCTTCGLKLASHKEMDVAGLGGQYTKAEYQDPAQFYGMTYLEPDYGND